MEEKKQPLTYAQAGVDITAGNKAVEMIKSFVKSTYRPEVLSDIGGFSGLFLLDIAKYKEPVLVSSTDGVGTKLRIAHLMDKHDTIGIDAVAMCVNDILVQGAEPLFFLDYIAIGKLKPERIAEIVKGISEGCKQAGCALIGGETAEMPGFYAPDEYDIAGFVVGIVEKSKILDKTKVSLGDVLIGVKSSGVHSNGYSLVRKALFEEAGYDIDTAFDELETTLGEELLKPTKIYVKSIYPLFSSFQIKGIAHITGGGITENVPRALPHDLSAVVDLNTWEVPAIFDIIKRTGDIAEQEMFRTFNMGIGMVIIVSQDEADDIVAELKKYGEDACIIGEVVKGDKKVLYKK